MDSLGRHVIGCTDEGDGGRRLGAKEPAQAQVTQLHNPLARDKHVGGLDVWNRRESSYEPRSLTLINWV